MHVTRARAVGNVVARMRPCKHVADVKWQGLSYTSAYLALTQLSVCVPPPHILLYFINTYLTYSCVGVCGWARAYAPAPDTTIRQVLQRRTSGDGVKQECENGQCAAQEDMWATKEVVWCCQGFGDC